MMSVLLTAILVVLAGSITSFMLKKSQAHMVLPTTVEILLTITYNHISHVICGKEQRKASRQHLVQDRLLSSSEGNKRIILFVKLKRNLSL